MKNFLKNGLLLFAVLVASLLVSCGAEEDTPIEDLKSKRNDITSLSIEGGCLGGNITGVINPENNTIRITVPFGTDVKTLAPFLEISDKAAVTPASESEQNFTTPVTYTVTAENGAAQEWIVIAQVAAAGSEPKLTLSESVWELSIAKGGIPTWFTSNGEDGLAFGNDHLYAGNNQDKVQILDPMDGSILGELSNTGIDGGNLKLSDVETSEDGSILACNVVDNNGTATFKVYRWADESSAPVVFIEYTFTDQIRIGDNLSVVGDVTGDADIYTAFGRNFTAGVRGTSAYKWEVRGGVLNETPLVITGQGFGISGFGSRAHATALSVDDETVWVNGNDIDVTRILKSDGSIYMPDGETPSKLPNENKDLIDFFHNQFTLFKLCDKTIMVAAFPRSSKESRLVVIDVTKGLDKVTIDDVIKSADFVGGTDTANADASGNTAVNIVNEAEAEIYVLVTNQALSQV